MKIARRVLVVGLVLALSVTVFSVVSPRTAHSVVATFVQVTNDAAHPVPVKSLPTVLVGSGDAVLTPNSGASDFGPFDVSNYSNIRFYGDPISAHPYQVAFDLLAVSSSGNLFLLDHLSGSSNGNNPVLVTGAYPTPGISLKVRIAVSCVSLSDCPAGVDAFFVIYGR